VNAPVQSSAPPRTNQQARKTLGRVSQPHCQRPASSLQFWLRIGTVIGVAGCSEDTGQVTFRVTLPEQFSNPPAEMLLTRFYVARIADSLGARANVPKPDFSALESELTDFRPARSEVLDSLQSEWFSVRQGIVHLADSLRDVGRDAPGYAAAYDRLRTLHIQVTSRETDLERRMSQLVSPDRVNLARQAMAAADSLRAWETGALAAFPHLMDSLSGILGSALVLPLPSDGQIKRRLATGRWWVAMRIPHSDNPFLEYYWETSFSLNRLIPVVVPLDERHMTVRWRH